MRSRLRLLALARLLLLLQSLLTELLPKGPRPDLVLIFALVMGLRAAGTGGLVVSFLLGMAVDVLSGSPLGLYALLRGSACAATRLFDRAIYVRSSVPWAIYVGGYTLLDGALLGGVTQTLVQDISFSWSSIFLPLPFSAVFTALVAVPLLGLVRRWDHESQVEGSFAGLTSRVRP